MSDEVILLTAPTNYAVVRMPGRSFPGVVVQGDTLHSLVATVDRMESLLRAQNYEELGAEIVGVKEQIGDALARFEKTCRERGITLPYPT